MWTGRQADILIADSLIEEIGQDLAVPAKAGVVNASGLTIFPGLVDAHVHLREPGFEYKETIATGTRAAAAGGFTTVLAMPNTNPCPDNAETLVEINARMQRDGAVRAYPYAAITKGRLGREPLGDYGKIADLCCGFSDDGSGVADRGVMREAMAEIAKTGKVLAAHCEKMELIPKGGCIHDGAYARAHTLPGIPSESEWREVEENIELAAQTGCRLHICHVSTRESVALVRQAKREGLPVTCETGAHYLYFTQDDIPGDLGEWKMNPPLRDREDRDALIVGIQDGTIDLIASDHAPHSLGEKSRGLLASAMGITGIETSFPASYELVRRGIITPERLADLMSINARRIFGLPAAMAPGAPADITLVATGIENIINPDEFLSMGHSTPFRSMKFSAIPVMTICGGVPVHIRLTL